MVTPDRDKSHTEPVGADPGQAPGLEKPQPAKLGRTRVSGAWVAIIVAVILLVFLLVFILQNLDPVTVRFLGMAGTLPLGVGLLFAAIAGALLVFLVGTARMVQLRRMARKAAHRR